MGDMTARRHIPLVVIDPAWFFLLPGLALVAAAVLIPAFSDLDRARDQRDMALAIEEQHLDRLRRYAEYLDAIDRGDEPVVLSLAAMQLNMLPVGRASLIDAQAAAERPASVLPFLEPDAVVMPLREPTDSILSKLALHPRRRLWLMAVGVLGVLIGILPATKREVRPAP